MILFTPVPAVATPETAVAAIVTAIVTATGPSDASRATAGAEYRVSHLTHFPSQFWSKGAAQTQQVVRIIVLLKPESL